MNQITHPNLVRALVKPGHQISTNMTPMEADLWHGATGVAGECGEVLDAIIQSQLSGFLPDRENLVEEFGDMEFYLEQVRQNLGVSRRQVIEFQGPTPGAFDLLLDATSLAVAGSILLDLVKKVVVYKKDGVNLDIMQALARIEIWMMRMRDALGITREETIDGNIAKLSVRYSSGSYSNEQAQARADKVAE